MDFIRCTIQRRPVKPNPDVDTSDMYHSMVNRDCAVDGFFSTCLSHRNTLEQQIHVFAKLSTDDDFWTYLKTPKRKPTLPIHHRIEDFIRRGIPPQFRGRVWDALCSSHIEPAQFMSYEDIFDLPRQATTAVQISLDVKRTFQNLRDTVLIAKLERVLTGISLRNPKIGYCQSMNFVAGTLLIFMEEESAFWAMVYIIENLLHHYYEELSGFMADVALFEWLVSDNLPELYHHLKKVNFSFEILTAPWFLSLYVNDLPIETAYMVWDNIMLDGIVAMFEVGLAILRMLEDGIRQLEDIADLTTFFRERTGKIRDPEQLRKHWWKLDRTKMMTARRNIKARLEEESKLRPDELFSDLSAATHFTTHELGELWTQYAIINPHVDADRNVTATGMDFITFSQFIGGTFSEWLVDKPIVRRLYRIADVDRDQVVDFHDLMMLLSKMCRGTPEEVLQFTFSLFDSEGKGWMSKDDLRCMLLSIYSVYGRDRESAFKELLGNLVEDIYSRTKGKMGITKESFAEVVYFQSQVQHKFSKLNPKAKFNLKHTFFYWVFKLPRNTSVSFSSLSMAPSSPSLSPTYRSTPRDVEMVHIILNKTADKKQQEKKLSSTSRFRRVW